MNDSLKKTSVQKSLFDDILKKLPSQHSLVDVVSDLLGVSSDAAYRRIRCDKIMDIDEVGVLCSRFDVSLDSLLDLRGADKAGESLWSYTPMNLDDMGNYSLYMRGMAARLESLCTKPGAEIVSSALDVPFFHFLPYKELTFFKLFAWTNSVYPTATDFEEFARGVATDELMGCYKKIVSLHRLIPSKEIWTKTTTDTLIKLIGHHFEMGHFSDVKTPLVLCKQFLDLLDSLEQWAEAGNKGEAGVIPFQLYLSDVDMENSFILLKERGATSCILKLLTINSLYVTDPLFCSETDNWLESLSRRATLISGSSEKERHKFFNHQRQKVRFLIEMISSI